MEIEIKISAKQSELTQAKFAQLRRVATVLMSNDFFVKLVFDAEDAATKEEMKKLVEL
jgi:hypothetical protein